MRYYDGKGPEPEWRPADNQENDQENRDASGSFGVNPSMRILEQGRSAVMHPVRLPGLGSLPGKKFAGYSFALLTLVSVVIYVIPMIAAIIGFGGFEKLFNEKIPEIHVENGVLTAEDRFEMAVPNMHVVIDTSEEAGALPDTDTGGLYLIFGSREYRLTILETAGSQRVSQNFLVGNISDILPDGTVRSDLEKITPAIYVALFLTWVIMIFGLYIRYFFMALIYMLFTVPLVRRSGLALTNGEIFRMCFYAETTGILLVNINMATGLLPGAIVSVAGMIITCVYIFKSMKEYIRPASED